MRKWKNKVEGTFNKDTTCDEMTFGHTHKIVKPSILERHVFSRVKCPTR